jgi:hypothetical protein
MNKLSSIVGVAPLAVSSAVVVPLLMLVAVVAAVVDLVVGMDYWKTRKSVSRSERPA